MIKSASYFTSRVEFYLLLFSTCFAFANVKILFCSWHKQTFFLKKLKEIWSIFIKLLFLAHSLTCCHWRRVAVSVKRAQRRANRWGNGKKWQPCTASYDTYRPSQTSTKGRKNERKEIQSDVKVKTIDLRKSRSSRNVRLLSIGCSPSRTAIKYMSFINGDFINNKRIHLLLVSDFQLFNNLTTCEQTCQMWWANIHVLI